MEENKDKIKSTAVWTDRRKDKISRMSYGLRCSGVEGYYRSKEYHITDPLLNKSIKCTINLVLNLFITRKNTYTRNYSINYILKYQRTIIRIITRSVSARRWESDMFDARPKPRHS